MRDPLQSKTGRHYKYGGTVQPLDVKAIDRQKALPLLAKVRRQGTYRPYLPYIIEALSKLETGQHITFHVPVINGRDNIYTAKHLMSVINVGLSKSNISHRLRYVSDDHLLISEPVQW